MIDVENSVRLISWLPRPLFTALQQAARACDEPLHEFIRHRLADSLPHSTPAGSRSGCAGNGEVALPASPDSTA